MSVLANAFTRRRPGAAVVRLLASGLLAATAALLVSCGSSSKGLIPLANAGPLQSDFEAVAQAAQAGDGNCAETEAKINATERDFEALPSAIDAGLRRRLEQGIKNLRERALALCAQPITQTATTRTTPRTTTTVKTPAPTTATTAPTTSTPTTTTQTTPTTPAPKPPNTGGGTVAPGSEGNNEGAHGNPGSGGPGAGSGAGQGAGQENGGAGESGGAPAGGQEAGK